MSDIVLVLEAILFASKEPLSVKELALRAAVEEQDIEPYLRELASLYEERAVELVERDGRYALQTRSEYASFLSHEQEESRDLSRAALEVLGVIAYHQPITRAEIEAIRGVGTSKGSLDMLMEQGWIKPGSRRDELGRPGTWLTTSEFCDAFGLESLKDLPGLDELRDGGFIAANDTLPNSPQKQSELFEN